MANNDYSMVWSDQTLKSGFTLEGGTTDTTTTSLSLTGKGVYLWGQKVQENFIKLLENFASHGTPPANPTKGQLWFNASNNSQAYYNTSSQWQYLAAIDPTTGVLPPSIIPAKPYMLYQGTWNPATNTPALRPGIGTQGYAYKVSASGTLAIDGNSTWAAGDYIIFNGTTWDRLLGPNGGTPVGGIILWSGSAANIPAHWLLCDGNNGTPDLRDRFVVGAGLSYAPLATGGIATNVLSQSQMPSHTHGASAYTDAQGAHAHGGSVSPAGDHQHQPQQLGSTQAGRDNGGNATSVPNGFGLPASDRYMQPDYPAGAHTHAITTDVQGYHAHNVAVSIGAAGGGAGIENRPPYYALAYIMYVG
jgi:microcystin-dependent protein